MRTFAGLLLVAAGCTRPAAPPPLPSPPPPSKYTNHNVVFVSFDALQAAHVGCQGHTRNTTPTIDAMAARGVRFANTYSVASWTVPASMTWFTGVYPSEHRLTNKFAVYDPPVQTPANLRALAPDLVTLADVLRQNGYATVGFTGNAGVSGGFGYEQGFDLYRHDSNVFGSFDQSIPRAVEWLRLNRGKKFFLFLHGYDIHGQNTPAGGFDYRFVAPGYDGKFIGSEAEQEALREEGLRNGSVTLRPADVQFWRAVYDEKVQRADAKFRDFLADFDALGLTGNTVFVLSADHGTEVYEHRRFDHGYTLYDEQIRVPLVFVPPGRTSGVVVDHRVSSIDVMPTVLDLLDVPVTDGVRKQLRGTSLVPAMTGAVVDRDCFSETNYRDFTFKRSVVTPDGWKLICTLESKSRELYHLPTDPAESADRSAAEPGRADDLERKLFAHFRRIGHDLTARKWQVGLNPVYNSQAVDGGKK